MSRPYLMGIPVRPFVVPPTHGRIFQLHAPLFERHSIIALKGISHINTKSKVQIRVSFYDVALLDIVSYCYHFYELGSGVNAIFDTSFIQRG